MCSAEPASGRHKVRGGFTLIEVVVAVVILATALVASMTAHATELRSLTTAREVNLAVELANERMASVELFSRDRLPSIPDSLEQGTFARPFQHMRWEADARSVLGTALVEVTVTVSWETGQHAITKVVAIPTPVRSP